MAIVYQAYPMLLGPTSPAAFCSAGAIATGQGFCGGAAVAACVGSPGGAYAAHPPGYRSSPRSSTRWLAASPTAAAGAPLQLCPAQPAPPLPTTTFATFTAVPIAGAQTAAAAPVVAAAPQPTQRALQPQRATGGVATGPLSVGGRTFDRLRELGSGSFGVVWEVRERYGTTSGGCSVTAMGPRLALKCTTPSRKEALESCLIEVEVLQQLVEAFPKDSEAARRVPRYIAHSVEAVHTAPGSSVGEQRVLVAMTKLGGQPLDQWLYGVDEHRLKNISITELLEGPLPGSQLATRDLQEACEVVAGLMSQMAPVFRALSDIAFHRDVSAHNFLISMGSERQGDGPPFAGSNRRQWDQSLQRPQFAVLDFGLAVRTRSWQQEWQCRNIAGDPRYFSPAAWMLLAYGHKYLEAHPDANLKRQYKYRIDHFAFGVLALEVLFALWRGPEESAISAETPCEAVEQDDEHATAKLRRQALQRARSAWHTYWAGVMGLFQKFHAEGAVVVRDLLARSQTISRLADELRLLCSALRAAAALQPTGSVTASVLQIAAGLLDLRSLLSWQELPSMLPMHFSGTGTGRSTRACSVGVASRRQDDTDKPSPLSPCTKRFNKSQSHIRKHRRSWTIMETDREQAQQSEAAEEAATLNAAACNKINGQAASAVAEAQPSSTAEHSKALERRFSHRRVWTVDEAVSLRRGLPQLGMAQSEGHVSSRNKEDGGTPTAAEGAQRV